MSFVKDIFNGLTGRTAADASIENADIQAQAGQDAIEETRRASEQGLSFLSPFGVGGEQALFDSLQSNPLFKLALENANQDTLARGAARGRLNAGDTFEQLSNNVLLSASPIIDRQQNAAIAQANTATGAGNNISNLITDIGATRGAGKVGAANASGAGAGNLLNTALLAGGIF